MIIEDPRRTYPGFADLQWKGEVTGADDIITGCVRDLKAKIEDPGIVERFLESASDDEVTYNRAETGELLLRGGETGPYLLLTEDDVAPATDRLDAFHAEQERGREITRAGSAGTVPEIPYH